MMEATTTVTTTVTAKGSRAIEMSLELGIKSS